MKRISDFALATVAVLFLMPLFVAVGMLILLADGRPIIYRRRVIGRDGEFDAFKFRTMRKDSAEWLENRPSVKAEFERDFKLRADPRVTKIGHFLRRTSIDELPQLFNVIRGEMSLVGPRMITRAELIKYKGFEEKLMTVKPGITGLWQVSGRQNVGYEIRVKADMEYIDKQSLWLDFKILMITPFKVLKREGAF